MNHFSLLNESKRIINYKINITNTNNNESKVYQMNHFSLLIHIYIKSSNIYNKHKKYKTVKLDLWFIISNLKQVTQNIIKWIKIIYNESLKLTDLYLN